MLRQFFTCLVILIIPLFTSAQNKISLPDNITIEELDKILKHLTAEQKVDMYIQAYERFINIDVIRAASFIEKALEILKSLPNPNKTRLGVCYAHLGGVDRILGNYNKGIVKLNKSISIFEEINSKGGIAFSHKNLGQIYSDKGEYNQGFKHLNKALELYEELNLKKEIAKVYNIIGTTYKHQKDYDNALFFFRKSFAYDKTERYDILNNMGTIVEKLNKLDTALLFYKRSFKAAQKEGSIRFMRTSFHNIANVFSKQGKYEKALMYLEKVQETEEKLNLNKELVGTYYNIGSVYYSMGKFSDALPYYKKALQVIGDPPNETTLKKIYHSISSSYQRLGNSDSAIVYISRERELAIKLYSIERDSLIEELLGKFNAKNKERELALLKNKQRVKELELKRKQDELKRQKLIREMEAEKSKKEILLLNQKNELQELSLEKSALEKERKEERITALEKEAEYQQAKEAELKHRDLVKSIAIAFATVLIFGAIVLIILYQQKLKATELLNIRTEEVNKQKVYQLLRDQEFSSIQAKLEGQEEERKRISQDLHDGIGGNLASIKLNLANLVEQTKDENLVKVMQNIDETYREVRDISHNLAPSKMLNHAFIQLIRNFLDEIINGKLIDVELTAFPEEELNQLPSELKIEVYRVIQELMNNVIKYSQAKNADIQLNLRDGQLNLMVEDNGVGFDPEKATNGIGLSNIKSRIKQLNGDVFIESAIGKWSLVNIEIPVNGAAVS